MKKYPYSDVSPIRGDDTPHLHILIENGRTGFGERYLEFIYWKGLIPVQRENMKRPLLILKVGTSSITDSNGDLDIAVIEGLANQLHALNDEFRILIVSSGAVGTGKRFLSGFSGKLIERKAAAAIGNPILVQHYSQQFARFGIPVAQSLCERSHFSDRHSFLRLRATFETLWKHGVIPIANENDVISDLELRFSDNDELATLLAVGLDAQTLLIGTSVPGLLDQNGVVVPSINEFDEQILGFARNEKSAFGLGGMISKLTFAKLATRLGVRVVIFGLREINGIRNALDGESGTDCPAHETGLTARKKWLASGSLVAGGIVLDAGAAAAIRSRKSLLAVGISKIRDMFDKNEVIELLDPSGARIALARSQISSHQLEDIQSSRNVIVAHADEIVVL